jgi:hypothetical protein
MCWSQPLVNGCDEDGRLVADREFVVARRHGAVSFEAVDPALDRVPSLVVLGVELGRSATARAALLAVGRLVSLIRDGASDSASSQVGAVLAGRVRLVCTDPVGPGSGLSGARVGDTNFLQDRFELRGVTALSGRDHDGHRLLALLDGQVHLGGQTAARAPKAVVVRLDGDPAGRLGL